MSEDFQKHSKEFQSSQENENAPYGLLKSEIMGKYDHPHGLFFFWVEFILLLL